jgi:hypothetical protein
VLPVLKLSDINSWACEGLPLAINHNVMTAIPGIFRQSIANIAIPPCGLDSRAVNTYWLITDFDDSFVDASSVSVTSVTLP